jgi:PAS domain S-box-containing protein
VKTRVDVAPQRFDLLVEQVVDYAIFLLDPDGMVATWNPGAARIKGYTASEIIGRPYATFFTPEDRQRSKPNNILAQAREQGRFQEEGWRLRKDGSRFWASVVITALRDDSGALTGFAKITRDLTDRLREEENARRLVAEEAARRQAQLDQDQMREARDRLDLILRSISEGVTVQGSDMRLVFANEAAAQLSGFDSVADMVAAPPTEFQDRFELLDEDGRAFPFDNLPGRRAFDGNPARALVRFRHKRTGEERWALVSAAPVLNPSGRVDLIVNVFRDVTETKRTERGWQFLAQASAALGSSLEYGETLAQVARLAVPDMADGCTIELLANDGGLQQLESAHFDSARAAAVRQWRERSGGPGPVSLRALHSGKPELITRIDDDLLAATSADPEYRQFVNLMGVRSAMVVPLMIGGIPAGVISFMMAESGRRFGEHDLNVAIELARRASLAIDNARAYQEARAAIQIRDTFLSVASHELRTPLSSLTITMTSLVRMAQQGRLLQLGEDKLTDRLVKADRQAQQLAQLVDRLLDVSRLSSAGVHLEFGEVDLAEVAREVAARFEDPAAQVGCSLELSLDDAVPIRGDRARLDQVISNLLANALKYAPGSPVRISVRRRRDLVELVVEDGGPGIPPEHQKRIFDQYERAVSSNVPGLGLGLWIVRRIVAAHGGTITVSSSPGAGARFTVVLPAETRRQEVA